MGVPKPQRLFTKGITKGTDVPHYFRLSLCHWYKRISSSRRFPQDSNIRWIITVGRMWPYPSRCLRPSHFPMCIITSCLRTVTSCQLTLQKNVQQTSNRPVLGFGRKTNQAVIVSRFDGSIMFMDKRFFVQIWLGVWCLPWPYTYGSHQLWFWLTAVLMTGPIRTSSSIT